MKPIVLQIAANDRAQGMCQIFVKIPHSAQTKTEGQMDNEKKLYRSIASGRSH